MKKLIYFGLILSLLSSPPLMAQGQKHSTYYEQRASHFRSLASKKKCIVFLGDSLSDGAEWSELFSRQDILNRGISGDTSTGVLDRLDEVVRHQPKKIFLLIGINDIARDISLEQICHNIFSILKRIKKDSPATQVYVQSLLPVNDRYNKFLSIIKNASLIPLVNKELEANAQQYHYTYIDLNTRMANSSGKLKDEFTNDGVHLLQAGYKHWAEIIKPYLH